MSGSYFSFHIRITREIHGFRTALEDAAAKVELQINVKQTEILDLLDGDPPQDGFVSIPIEKVEEFQCLGALLSRKNDRPREISVRIAKAERASFALSKFHKSKAFSEETKLSVTTTSMTARRLRTFESKIWRTICGPVRNTRINEWSKKFNKKLQEELGLAPVTKAT